MRWPVKILLAAVLVALAGFISLHFFPEPEPVYQGKRLTDWLLDLNVHNFSPAIMGAFRAKKVETDIAVIHMGTNAVPTLLRLLRKRDSALLLHLLALAQKQHFVKISHVPAEDWNNMAANAFFVLGHSADYAAPELVEIYERNLSSTSRRCVLLVLGNIGPPAKKIVPSLLPMTTAPDYLTRHDAVWALAQIHREPELVIPVLITSLHDPDPSVRVNATVGLGAFGPAAKQSVPALVEKLKDQNSDINRDEILSALRSIDPEAAAKAGMN